MTDEAGVFHTETSPGFGLSVDFEDDGRVGYAYLIDSSDQIIADVWLYNRAPTPIAPEWHDGSAAPFLNPARYVRTQAHPTPARDPSDVSFRWLADSEHGVVVEIFLRGYLTGRIWPGAKPGWAAGARSGPLASGPEEASR
jgi:hypothetical protein